MAWMIAVLMAASIFGAIGWPTVGLVLVVAGAVIAAVWRTPGINAAVGGSDMAMGYPYLGLAAVALPWLRADQDAGLANTLFLLSVVWASDIGAYIIGRLIGGPKLAPVISPGKTWSGAAGGLAGAALAGSAVAYCFSSGFSPSHVAGLAIGLGIVSQVGDLLESALKRHFGVKDSGSIIPGHGGLLDRLDALLAAGPAAAVLASFVGRGVVLWR
jgi:phosphatidate cytidylyltransferase